MAKPDPSARPVVTRFAPSPTGYLHIGGARTALFNWLYARGRNGKFLLRIEDTDRKRHNEKAVDAILDGLKWLGLDWDDEPISQYARRERHIAVVQQLLETGNAYRCYLTAEQLDAAREKAKADGIRFESPWRNTNPSSAPKGAPYAVRFKAPVEGVTTIDDAVQGEVSFPNKALDDLIIMRSDGGPTYNLAVVVDDYDMNVSHIIRGDDHLNNAARQKQIYDALGWATPTFAHVPLIHGEDGKKLSKRHGALGVEAYRDLGYLPDGLANYLLRLGWAHGDDEIIPIDNAIEWFNLSGLNKAPARLDVDKLNHINAHYMARLNDQDFVKRALLFLTKERSALQEAELDRLSRAAQFLKSRCANFAEAPKAAEFLFLKRPINLEGKSAKPLRKEGAMEMLSELLSALNPADLWNSADTLESRVKALAEDKGVGFGAVGAPTRAALTGGLPSPSLGEVLYSLGQEEALARIRDQID